MMQRFLLQHCSCVFSMIGSLSFGFTSLLLPANATQRPGMHPLTQASLRMPRVCPSQLRTPLVRSLNCFAMPLHTNKGAVIHSGETRFVQGASCLHSLLLLLLAHAFGIRRFSWFVFGSTTRRWMWCWQRLWKCWKALLNHALNSAPSLVLTGDVVLSCAERVEDSGASLASAYRKCGSLPSLNSPQRGAVPEHSVCSE